MPGNISNRPQQVTALTISKEYEIGRPQSPFVIQPPLPPGFDNELIEEVSGTIDLMIYDESGSGNDGFVQIGTAGAQEEALIVYEESTGVFGNVIYDEDGLGSTGFEIERGG